MRVARLVVVAASVGVLTLSGCSGDDDKGSEDDKTPTDETTSQPVITPEDVPGDPATLLKKKDRKGIVGDTEMSECGTEPGDVTANGTVTNTGKDKADIVVSVAWVVPAGSDVVARATQAFDKVKPGGEVEWSLEASVPEGDAVQCVLSAYAGTSKS
jgi:hypothetical protein